MALTVFLVASWMAVTPVEAGQCYDCHGSRATADNRPLDGQFRDPNTGAFQGNHQTHLPSNATARDCAKCHPGSTAYTNSHRNGMIRVASQFGNYPEKALYGAYTRPFRPSTDPVNPNLKTCSNVDCHFIKTTDSWGSPYFDKDNCNGCHGGPPNDGSHARHFEIFSSPEGKRRGNICVRCHSFRHDSFGHATSAGRRGLLVVFPDQPNSSGSYSGDLSYPNYLTNPSRNGDCTNLFCHSNADPYGKTNIYKTVTWGSPQSMTCTSCHDTAGLESGLSGRHDKHTTNIYGYTCERCHQDTVAGNDTIKNKSKHANTVKDVTFTYNKQSRGCGAGSYCHSDGKGGEPVLAVTWAGSAQFQCDSCHKGTTSNSLSMTSNGHDRLVGAQWIRKYPCSYCHSETIKATAVESGVLGNNDIVLPKHINGVRDVSMAQKWYIDRKPFPSYSTSTKTCYNVYCHSDGTDDPKEVKAVSWTGSNLGCDGCHGHKTGIDAQGQSTCAMASCHDGRMDSNGKVWKLPKRYETRFNNHTAYSWPPSESWKASVPMFENEAPHNMLRANSHTRHITSDFTCDLCHYDTVLTEFNQTCNSVGCHPSPTGTMTESAHVNGSKHVNKDKDVVFKGRIGQYTENKTCVGIECHSRAGSEYAPTWGGSVNGGITCLSCHGTEGQDTDDFSLNGVQTKINETDWYRAGHGRYSTAGRYPISGNPAANFKGNPCWYCHDNTVLHKDDTNIYRLRLHPQFSQRFDKECGYCHMEGNDAECISCHDNSVESIAVQLNKIDANPAATWPDGSAAPCPDHKPWAGNLSRPSCLTINCHYVDRNNSTQDMKLHNTRSGFWTSDQRADVRNQYMMMGVCLQCHDDDSNNKCEGCHGSPLPLKYSLGFNPGTNPEERVKPKKARASSTHFGYKHFRAFNTSEGWTKVKSDIKSPIFGRYSAFKGTWKGGKFCWDCHDPHGDSNLNGNGVAVPNIYMIQSKVATETEGVFGKPKSMLTRAKVVFTSKNSGSSYVKTTGEITGICNVCHSPASKHFTSVGGDGHNQDIPCTRCHEHRFSDGHGDALSCSSCHKNKPVPRHSGFGLPRDCTKCHAAPINAREDVMGQFRSPSHHVQGKPVTNQQCFNCHWEATAEGLIDLTYHEGYNFRNNTTVRNAKSDLVVWGRGTRPSVYRLISSAAGNKTAVTFTASNMLVNTPTERTEVAKINTHCISCHSDQNNDTTPFGDCKTPRQYAWDKQSIDARYSQNATTTWGKYASTTNAAKKGFTKALSAHGNAASNQGGWNATTGLDAINPATDNSRGGTYGVQCFDCHNSHGSAVEGVTTSYLNHTGVKNGGNLKETQKNKGGYKVRYMAKSNPDATFNNPYNAGAGQCFDCHLTGAKGETDGSTPWGYNSTFGATKPIKGYKDAYRFGERKAPDYLLLSFKNDKTVLGGHLKRSTVAPLEKTTNGTIDGLCTPCHDPHGVSPTLGDNKSYAVPLLKGTYMTSPYKEDWPAPDPTGSYVTYQNGVAMSWGQARGGGGHPTPTQPYIKYWLDSQTFGGSTRLAETADKFAGLCLSCHPKANLTDGINKNSVFRSVDRVHESVKGWGENKEHSYSCSKCHQPHQSGLPRLMQTNCLDYQHRGNRPAGGRYWNADKQASTSAHGHNEHRGYPKVDNGTGAVPPATESATACHIGAPNNQRAYPDGNYWNQKTPWPVIP